jgi:hypothetical protein
MYIKSFRSKLGIRWRRMGEDSKNPTFVNKLDKLLEEYAQKRRLMDDVAGDIYEWTKRPDSPANWM